MPVARMLVVVAALMGTSLALAADDLRLLSQKLVTGELVSIDDKNIVLKTKDGVVITPIATEVQQLDSFPVPTSPLPPCTLVELTDESKLYCKPDGGLVLDKNKVKLTLLSGQQVEVPLRALSYVLKNANDAKVRENPDWKALFKGARRNDLWAKWIQLPPEKAGDKDPEPRLNGLDGTFGDAGDGTVLTFTSQATKREFKADLMTKSTQGWIFSNKPEANAPVTLCKVYDVNQNVVAAQKLELKEGGTFVVTSVTGAHFEYPRNQVARLDFSKGKLEFLSGLEAKVEVEPSEDRPDRVRKDKNLDDGKLQLGGQKYDRGLAIPAPTTLMYKLGGEFKEFSFVLGVDETVQGASQVEVVVDGDGKKLFSAKVSRQAVVIDGKTEDKPKKFEAIRLNVKDVQELRIIVKSTGLFDYGNHVNFADAKINK